MKKITFFVLAFALLATACNSSGTVSPTVVSTPTAIPSKLPADVPSVTIAPTNTPDSHLSIKCLEILPTIPSDSDLAGVVALKDLSPNLVTGSYFLDMETGEREIDNSLTYDFIVSPDHTKYANYDRVNKHIVLKGVDGRIYYDWYFATPIFELVDWPSENEIIFSKHRGLDPTGSYSLFPFATMMINFKTGEQQELPFDYPDIWIFESPSWGRYGLTRTVYDPTFSFVVYPSGKSGIVLWDINANREIAHFMYTDWFGSAPTWSPDGSRFLIDLSSIPYTNHKEELFTISQDGHIEQLTYLNSYYQQVDLFDYMWSPDGRYAAFWLNTIPSTDPLFPDEENNRQLAVLDTSTKQVTSYCISEGVIKNSYRGDITWSFDSKRMLVLAPNGGDDVMVVLVDIVHGYAAKIAENMVQLGWLVDTP